MDDSKEVEKIKQVNFQEAHASIDVAVSQKCDKVVYDFSDSTPYVEEAEELDDETFEEQYNPELAIPVEQSDTDVYDMSRQIPACAIIINIEKFYNVKQFETRNGSQADVDRLVDVFGNLNIDVGDRVYTDLTYNSMRNRFTEFLSNKALLSTCNSIIVVILSHGLEGDMIMASDTQFHLYDLIKRFTPDELPEMATRPKIFIIQACRGNTADPGLLIKRNRRFSVDSVDSVACDEETPFKYPSHADICIALSSHHGHKSFRNENGSWYIQDLCHILDTLDLTQNHFIDILTETNRIVATRVSRSNDNRCDDKKQVSSYYATFTQKFYLRKGERKDSLVAMNASKSNAMPILKMGLLVLNIFIFFSKK